VPAAPARQIQKRRSMRQSGDSAEPVSSERGSHSMKRLGIVGGIGPESTIAYYRAIIGAGRETSPDRAYPPMLINSIDVQRVLQLVADGKLAALTEYLVAEVDVLEKSGAALGLIAASTPHIVFDEVARRSPIPLLSIV